MDGVEKVDEFALKILQHHLRKQELVVNRKRQQFISVEVGEWVFLHRPTVYAGSKMQTS